MYKYIHIFGPSLYGFDEMAQQGRRITLMRNEVKQDFPSFLVLHSFITHLIPPLPKEF